MTNMVFKDRKERAEAYLSQSLRYLENADEALKSENPDKAGEFLWGSVATAFKALLMAKKGEMIRSHGKFWDIARELTRETGDESIYKSFREANSLHSNFYDSKLTSEDIKISSSMIIDLVRKLIDLTKQALEEEQR